MEKELKIALSDDQIGAFLKNGFLSDKITDDVLKVMKSALSFSFDFDTLLAELGKMYVKHCGISTGYRTIIWDMMVSAVCFHHKKYDIDDYEDAVDYVNSILDNIDKKHNNYSIGIILPEEEPEIMLDFFKEVDTSEQLYVAHGIFCFMNVCLTEQ
jgi:hypothetical protein